MSQFVPRIASVMIILFELHLPSVYILLTYNAVPKIGAGFFDKVLSGRRYPAYDTSVVAVI